MSQTRRAGGVVQTISLMNRSMLSNPFGFCCLQLSAFVALVVVVCIQPECAAQESKKETEPTTTKTLLAKDKWPIRITYYKSQAGKDAPVVVLLHSIGGNQLVWHNGFAEALQQQGYAVITFDFRKHGKSRPPKVSGDGKRTLRAKSDKAKKAGQDLKKNDYERMVHFDLEAVKKFIYDQHQARNLNMRKLAIIATEMSTPIAVSFAWRDWLKKPYDDNPNPLFGTPRGQDVQALVLLSPTTSCPGVSTTQPIKFLRQRKISFLICVGSKDHLYRKTSKKLYKQLGGENQQEGKERVYLREYSVSLRGADLIGKNIKTEPFIFAFLDRHLKQRKIPWRDRKSPLMD